MAHALAGHKLINAFPDPMRLLGQSRQVMFANPPALLEQEAQSRLAREGAFLRLVNCRSQQSWAEQLHQRCRQPHDSVVVLDLRRTAADPPTWPALVVLRSAEVMGAFGEQPQILATLFEPRRFNALDTFALGNLFGLTPAQARVAGGLPEGLAASGLAAAHGVAIPTVRKQIAAVVAKLGAGRAVDVVRMLRQREALWSTADKVVRVGARA